MSLYLENGYSNTVTVIRVPDGIKADDILELMKKDHNIMIAGSFDVLDLDVSYFDLYCKIWNQEWTYCGI